DPGIYYNPATRTVCVVGGEANDQVGVSRDGVNIVFVLDTGSGVFTFATNSRLVARFHVDTRGGDDTVGIAADVLQPPTIDAGVGNDTVNLGGGPGLVFGGEGNDALNGGSGRDVLVGNAGDDRMDGGANNDVLHGGAGNDDLAGGEGADVVSAGAGDDE